MSAYMGMEMNYYGENVQEMQMRISPRVRSKPLPKKSRKRLFRFTGKTVKQKEKHDDNTASS